MCRTRALPWFGLAVLLAIVGVVAGDTARAFVEFVAFVVFIGASIRYIGLAGRDDPVRSRMVARSRAAGGGYDGWMAAEFATRRRRRAAARRAKVGPERHDT